MATPIADPLIGVNLQADLGFAAGVTITQSAGRVQNADGSEWCVRDRGGEPRGLQQG